MKRIGLLSDTHSFVDERIFTYFEACDEIWHAGDLGNAQVLDQLEAFRPVRAVFGNIDGPELRARLPENLRFDCEGMDVLITHIGGYPGKYAPRIRLLLQAHPPKLFVCGHSHILKVMYDKTLGLLHLNPGACGKEGFHKVQTVLRFTLSQGRISDLEVVEWK